MQNPIKEIRVGLKKSRKSWSETIGIHPQCLFLLEEGVYESVLPKVLDYLHGQHYNTLEIFNNYKLYQINKRKVTGETAGLSYITVQDLGPPVDGVMRKFREMLGFTQSAFCKSFCVHPSLQVKCERGETLRMPTQIKTALSQAGLSSSVLNELDERIDNYAIIG